MSRVSLCLFVSQNRFPFCNNQQRVSDNEEGFHVSQKSIGPGSCTILRLQALTFVVFFHAQRQESRQDRTVSNAQTMICPIQRTRANDRPLIIVTPPRGFFCFFQVLENLALNWNVYDASTEEGSDKTFFDYDPFVMSLGTPLFVFVLNRKAGWTHWGVSLPPTDNFAPLTIELNLRFGSLRGNKANGVCVMTCFSTWNTKPIANCTTAFPCLSGSSNSCRLW